MARRGAGACLLLLLALCAAGVQRGGAENEIAIEAGKVREGGGAGDAVRRSPRPPTTPPGGAQRAWGTQHGAAGQGAGGGAARLSPPTARG